MGRGALGMLGAVLAACVLFLGAGASGVAAGQTPVAEGEPLVIRFDKGQKALTAADRAAIQRLMGHQKPGKAKKILVVGYSDDRGNAQKNMQLSRQRAEAVRKEIIRASGADGQHVLAVGRGTENPVGDDRNPQGRARNRRVEVYWTQAVDMNGKAIVERPVISSAAAVMVQDARTLIRRRQLIDAVRLLEQARDQGGEDDSNWQAVYGIAGFYAGMDAHIVKNHLSMALAQDPFNQEARDYLGRILAREKVADGTVNMFMGHSEQDPIPVSSDAQVHEYLHLFDAQPLSKQRSLTRPVEAWHCRDNQGRPVVYYFDRSQVYTWAFARSGSERSDPGDSGPMAPAR